MAGFKDVIGHHSIIEHFKNAIQQDKLSHAYILNGEIGSGKKTLAKAFIMQLMCENQENAPCMECRSCKQMLNYNQPDVKWVTHEKVSSIGVDDIRKQINNDIVIKPYSSKYKVYVIDEAEKMTDQAQNALLKTIEEPPEYAVIMLLTTNADAFLPTILSRCVTLNLKPISDDLIREYLLKQVKVPDYIADISVAFAGGNLGKAVKLASSEHFMEMKDEVLQLLKNIADISVVDVIAYVKRASVYKLDIDDYMDLIMIWYRDVLMYKASKDVEDIVFKDEYSAINEQASKLSYNGIEKIMNALMTVKVRLKANVNFDLTIELLYLTIKECLGVRHS